MEILRQRDVEFEVIEYLKTPLSRAYLEALLELFTSEASELVRKDKRFKDLELNAQDYVTKNAVVEILLQYPALTERPVVVKGKRAVIARPSEKVEELL